MIGNTGTWGRLIHLIGAVAMALALGAAAIPSTHAGVASAEISVMKFDDPDPVVAGSTLTYTVVVANAGPSTAEGVLMVDQLPEEVSFDSVTATQGTPEHLDGTVSALLGPLTAGQVATIEIAVTVDPLTTDPITNMASAEALELDPVPGNNFAQTETEVIFPDILVDPSVLAFGTQDAGDGPTDAMTVTITNEGTADLGSVEVTIEGQDAGQFAITADTGEISIAPDGTRSVDVVFDPTGGGAKSAQMVIDSNDPDEESVVVQLSGTGLSQQVVISPLGIEFTSRAIDVGPSLPREVTITNGGNQTLGAIGVSLEGPNVGEFAISSDTGQTQLQPGQSRRVGVVFDPAEPGERFASLVVTSDDADSPSISVPLSGIGTQPQVTGDIGVEPTALDFGQTPVNTTHNPRLLFVISNFGVTDLEFVGEGVVLSGANSPEFSFTEPPDTSPMAGLTSRSFFVGFDPASEGMKGAEVTVTTDDPDEPSVVVTLTGQGGAPVSADTGLQTQEIVDDLLGRIQIDSDVNIDGREDAADAVTNENQIHGAP